MSLAVREAERHPLPGPGSIAAWAADALARLPTPTAPDALCAISVPAPVCAPERLLELVPSGDAMLWAPPGGEAIAGAGVAFAVRAVGRERFADVARAAEALWPRLVSVRHPAAAGPPPRLFGGLAFAPGAADRAPWTGLGDADFALPRWRLAVGPRGAGAELSLVVSDWDDPAVRRQIAGSIEAMLAALAAEAAVPAGPHAVTVDEQDPELWRRQVEAIRRAIVRQRCDKIVAARSAMVTLAAPPSTVAVLSRLGDRYPDCFRFAFRRGDATFLGATPERLVALSGDRFDTVALAGTAPVGHADELLASAKDRVEQAHVVRAIREALSPLASELVIPDEPEVRTLPGVLHLETLIAGRLARPAHVLELAAALHPTPAVGGYPRAAALAWIAEHEPEPRGWYAAPVGWFDAAGDGELAVAIRSGVIHGDRAWLHAGAGIVRDSDPDAELAETRLKLRALAGVLGVEG